MLKTKECIENRMEFGTWSWIPLIVFVDISWLNCGPQPRDYFHGQGQMHVVHDFLLLYMA